MDSSYVKNAFGRQGLGQNPVDRGRKELKAKATTDHEKKKAAYHKFRRLRRCQNAECGVILHRDRNAASNIAENFYRLKPCLGKLTAQKTQLRCMKHWASFEDSFGSIIPSMQPMKRTAHAVGPISRNIAMVF